MQQTVTTYECSIDTRNAGELANLCYNGANISRIDCALNQVDVVSIVSITWPAEDSADLGHHCTCIGGIDR